MLHSIDYKIFPLTYEYEERNELNIFTPHKKCVRFYTPVALMRAKMLGQRAPFANAYENYIKEEFKQWVNQFEPVSSNTFKNVFQYVYEASCSSSFYNSFPERVISGFKSEIEKHSSILPRYQTFYRGCSPNEKFTAVGDLIYETEKPMSLTLAPDVAFSHADRRCIDYPRRICKSIIYVIRNTNLYSRGLVINHDGVDLSNVTQSMKHEFEVILCPPFTLKITSREEFDDYTLLFINII